METLSKRPDDYCFFDFETRALPGAGEDGNLPTAGTYRYAKASFPIILTYAIGDGPVKTLALDVGFDPCYRFSLHGELMKFYARAVKREAWFVAWNTGFDRAVWNNWTNHPLAPEMTLDAMAQALAANLPADLESASTALGGAGKQKDGKKLIKLFSPEDGGTPSSHPEEWKRFKSYAAQDIDALRFVWTKTLLLPKAEWEEYWASERVNDRGVMVDTDFCRLAQSTALLNVEWSNRRLQALTGDQEMRVTMPKRIVEWVHENIAYPDIQSLMYEDDPDDEEIEDTPSPEPKLRLTRSIIRRVIAALEERGDSAHRHVIEVLEIREYGGGTSVSKFRKMADQQDAGRLKGQYVFNGAGQTGRFSSKGVQIHNLPRDNMGDVEEAAMLDISLPIDSFTLRYGSLAKALPRLIKPAFIASPSKTLVWCDWSNIEARVNPWLAQSRSGDAKLDVFRASDRYPDQPDIYKMTAADLLGCAAAAVTDDQRQSHGKVPELSLGFGGARGALLNMAANYNVRIGEAQADKMVEQWRASNKWARGFWDKLWSAIENALQTHMVTFKAGRVEYMYHPTYLRGSLICTLPGNRHLTYPECRWENVRFTDKVTGAEDRRWQITYRKGHGRAALWYGKACENVVQATAGSLLRDALVALRDYEVWMPVVLHTHDDICVEVDEDRADEAGRILMDIMLGENGWNGGLPLAAEATTHWYLSKAAGRKISAFTEDRKRA